MRKKIVLLALLCVCCAGITQAQQKLSVEERINIAISKFAANAKMKLDDGKKDQLKEVFTEYYTAQRKLREGIQGQSPSLASGLAGQDYQSIRKRSDKLIEKRDAALQKILSKDEYREWKKNIEPVIRYKRP